MTSELVLGWLSLVVGAGMTALLTAALLPSLRRANIRQHVREDGPESHLEKAGTPSMGGLAIHGSFLIIAAIVSLFRLGLDGRAAAVILFLVGMAVVGLLDDYQKLRRRGAYGFGATVRLIFEFALAGLFVWYVGAHPAEPAIPGLALASLDPAGWWWRIIAAIVLVGSANAVNLTDGLDGLAITPSLFVMGVLGIFAYVEGNTIYSGYLFYPYLKGAGELTVFGAAFVGAGLGFLWYNAYPAQIFMGDTGSLAIGGAMAVVSVLLKQEMLFPILGGLFVAEALSSQIQDKIGVRWLGRRIFYRAPLHHSLQHRGIAETKVVIRLWIISGILALVALATLKLR